MEENIAVLVVVKLSCKYFQIAERRYIIGIFVDDT